ncbi:hypothetical protein F511_43143 [Dorcoceras hygrometricum]|uniref:Uncharacterized protein n=1 Tax=Dorcoceras hygrometricum TaxID=472368 RepID=A0A2Z7CBJ4_9LAMI|nr:hypothetical protein F511_43143 [Dorcoceras hygrometricum]
MFTKVFDLPTEGITNFSEVPKDKVYDARSLFSQKGVQIDVHGKKKYMKHEFRLLNDILAKAITVKAGSFDSVTVERFQMMTAIQYGLKVNWGKVLFNVLKDMVDRSQKKAKGFAAQIGVLLKGIPAITMGDGVPFPSAKVLSMRTVHTYIVTNTTIDARTESEEPGMAKTPKAKKKPSSADEMTVDVFAELTASKKRSATEADAPIITKKRRTGKSKPSVSQEKLDIVQVATDVEPIQIVDPTQAAATVPSLMLKRKSRKRRLVLSRESDDDSSQFYARYGLIERSEREVKVDAGMGRDNHTSNRCQEATICSYKYRELLLRTVLESYQRYLTHDLPWNAMAIQVANLLSVAHSHSLEDLKAQQQELNIEMVQLQSSLPTIDYIDSGDVRLAHFYSIANSSCWVRPVFLMNGVWTPVQGPEFWSSSCNLSLYLDNLQMQGPAIQEIFVPLISFIEPDQYWATVPWLMRIWRWTKVCEEVVAFNLSGGLRPVRKDACYAITVHNLGVERIPANFMRLFAQGLACNSFIDSVVQKDLGDIEEVVLTGVEELDLVSSDVSTVYRSPSPPSPGVDSFEHDLRFALGPAIFSHVEQEECLYFVQIPDSPPAVSPHHESSSSSTDVSLHFDSTDVPVHAQAATHAPASSFETPCRVLERQSNTHTAQITDLKKGLMGPVGTIFGDLFDIKKKQREQDSRLLTMDEQIAAIRNEHLEFQSKIAADMLSLSTQVGDIADFLRSGVAKKGEMGSSSRPTTVRAQTQTLPPTTGTFEERVAQVRRHIIETGQVISVEEAAARVMEADRRESERLDRERRERRKSRSGTYKRRR